CQGRRRGGRAPRARRGRGGGGGSRGRIGGRGDGAAALSPEAVRREALAVLGDAEPDASEILRRADIGLRPKATWVGSEGTYVGWIITLGVDATTLGQVLEARPHLGDAVVHAVSAGVAAADPRASMQEMRFFWSRIAT